MTHPLPPAPQVVPDGSQTSAIPGLAPQSTSVPPINIYPSQQPPGQFFTAEQVEAARQQEKDKLYDRLTRAEEQLNTFKSEVDKYRQEREDAAKEAEDQRRAAEETARKAEEDKLSVTELLAKRDAEWKQQQEELKQQLEFERTIMQKDRELFALQSFIQRRVAEEVAADTIAPELLDYINGNTEAEVEASITRAKEKTASIVAGMGGQSPKITPGVSPAGFAPAGPLDNLVGTQQISLEQLQAMDATEYAEFRAKVGIDKAGNNKGLFN